MNATHNRRRLIAARRYARRQYLPGQAPLPEWDLNITDHDSRSVLRAVVKLANRRSHHASQVIRAIVDDGTDCGGHEFPFASKPCGSCARCRIREARCAVGDLGWVVEAARARLKRCRADSASFA